MYVTYLFPQPGSKMDTAHNSVTSDSHCHPAGIVSNILLTHSLPVLHKIHIDLNNAFVQYEILLSNLVPRN